jgi:hypothetical protein
MWKSSKLMKDTKEGKTALLMDRKIQYCQDVSFSQLDL